MSFRRRIGSAWPLVAALIAFALLLAGFAIAMTARSDGHFVYPLDDTYIQMAIAKNLARHGVWGVSQYEFSGAGSSLLWPLLLAAADRIVGVRDWTPLALNVLAAIAVLALADHLLRRHVASPAGRLAALALVIVGTPLYTLTLVGMEHTVECAAALALLALAARSFATTRDGGDASRGWLLPLVAAVLVAARYDAMSVVVPLLAVMISMRLYRSIWPIAACSVAPALTYAAVAWRHGWPPLPTAILIKQRLVGVDLASVHGVADVIGGGALTVLVNSPELFVLVLVAVALIAASRTRREDVAEREAVLLLLVFVGAALIHVQFGRLGWLYRYEAYLVVVGVVANAAALGHMAPPWWRGLDVRRRVAAVALCVLVVHPLLLRGFLASRDLLVDAETIYVQEYQWGRFFEAYPSDGGLIVSSLGLLAYVVDRPIVDSGGLATLELYPSARENRFDIGETYRVAEAKGARVSIVGDPESRTITGWRCVAAWTDAPDRIAPETIWVFAADADAGAHVTRDLKAFAAADRSHRATFTFPAPGSADCPAAR